MGTDNPIRWAEARRAKLERYARPGFLDVVREARDVCLPGVPLCALLGFAANGSRNENTTGWKSCSADEIREAEVSGKTPLGRDLDHYARTGLHELGPFGVEAGRAPNRVATARDCPWVTVAGSDAVRKVLGREAVTGDHWYDAIDDQIAVGVANLARHLRAMGRRLDPRLARDEAGKPVSPLTYAGAMMTWSAGGMGATHMNDYADQLARVPERERWWAFCRLAAAEDDAGAKHRQDEYSALRTLQKLEAGRVAAEFTGESDGAAWIGTLIGEDRDAVYERLVDIS